MAEADEPDRGAARLEARASGSARINQAGRDLHLHYQDGVRELRRAEPGVGTDECPYPGMTYFEREQARWFFGRDRLTAKLVARLDGRLRDGGMQAVVAPSGAGKSSLLNAGLLPRLEHGALPGSARWPTLVLTPTGKPLTALATRIASLAGVDPTVLAQELADDPTRCVRVLREHLPQRRPDTRVLLVVDQFEELFTLGADPRQQRAFVRALACLAAPEDDGRPLGIVVIGVRADFYASCANDPDLRDSLEDSPLVVGPMSETEIREAILYPARDVGLDLEPGLIELLLADLGGTTADGDEGNYEAGRLALLAHALRATWQQRHGHTLTVAGYRDTGGIAHAVATTADRIFNGLDPPGQDATPTLFLRLTKIGDGTEDTRRRVARADLLDGLSPDTAQPAVDAFTRGRLLTQDQDTVQITHEALLRAWPRLRQWIDGDRAGNLTRQELEEAAAGWDRAGRDASRLYRGTRLAVAHALATSGHGKADLSPVASAFLTASTAHERRARRRRVQGAVAALAVVTVASGLILQQSATARRERDTAISHQVKVEADRLRGTDVSLAAQLDITAYRLNPNPDLGATILSDATTTLSSGPIANQTERASSVAFSPDGRTLASGSGSDGGVRLWNVTDPTRPSPLGQPLTGHTRYLNSLVFSPDGRTLASAGTDDTVRLWNVADPASPTALGPPLAIHSGISGSVTFSPDGRLLAASDVDDEVRLWNVADPAHPVALGPLPGAHTAALSAAFGPNGHILASGGYDGAIRFWDVTDPAHPVALGQTPVAGPLMAIVSLAFGPDGYTLASSGVDGLRLWSVSDPARPVQLGQPLVTGYVATVSFSPDGRTLAGEGGDGTVRLWNVYNVGQPVPLGHPLTGHTDRVRSVAFRPDGGTLASASNDGTTRLWHIPRPVPLAPTGAEARAVAISPDWRTLARLGYDRSLRLWNVADPAHPAVVGETSAPDDVGWLAFGPDGHTLAGIGTDGVRLWNVADPAHPTPLGRPFTVRTDWARTLAFSPDGHTVASVGLNGNMQLWDVSDPARPGQLGNPLADKQRIGEVVAFSPDGRTLASADTYYENVWLWNIADPTHPVLINEPLRGAAPSGNMSSIAFSADGRTLAGGDTEGRMWLWDLSEPAHPRLMDQSSTGIAHKLVSMAFSPDGHTLAGGDSEGTTWLWNVSELPRHLVQLGQPLIGRHTQRGVTVAFGPDGQTLASIDGAGAVWLWPLDVEQAAQRICSATTNTLTRANWAQLVSADLAYDPPCR